MLVGFLLPGDSILFAAGLLAAEPVSDAVRCACSRLGAFAAAAAGNVVGYWTGHRFGRPWLLRRAGRAARHVRARRAVLLAYGWLAVVVARFVPWARTFTPVAGRGRPDGAGRRFVSATLAGAALWGAGLVSAGVRSPHELPWLRTVAYGVAAVASPDRVLAPLGGWLRRRTAAPGSEPEVGQAVDGPVLQAGRATASRAPVPGRRSPRRRRRRRPPRAAPRRRSAPSRPWSRCPRRRARGGRRRPGPRSAAAGRAPCPPCGRRTRRAGGPRAAGGVQHRGGDRVGAEGQAADGVERPVGDEVEHHPARPAARPRRAG